jgi:hypothetical protein
VALFDDSSNERPRNAFEEHLALPFRRAVDHVRERVADLTRKTTQPAFLEQYPARAVPFLYPLRYEFDLLSARPHPSGATGFEANAPVVDLGAFLAPVNNDGLLRVNREGAFYWCSTNLTGYMSLSYTADPGFGGNTFVNTTPVSGFFNRAIEDNGGALQENFFFGSVDYEDKAIISFDLELYDQLRGRRIHEERLPPQLLSAQNYANRETPHAIRFDPNTVIEPRLRLLEVRPGSLLDTDQAFDAAQFRAYLYLVIEGYKVLAT